MWQQVLLPPERPVFESPVTFRWDPVPTATTYRVHVGGTQYQVSENELTVDLEACVVITPDGARHGFDIDGFARYCLLNGMDRLDFLLAQDNHITSYEANHER